MQSAVTEHQRGVGGIADPRGPQRQSGGAAVAASRIRTHPGVFELMTDETTGHDVVGILGPVDDVDDGETGELRRQLRRRGELDEERRTAAKSRQRVQRVIVRCEGAHVAGGIEQFPPCACAAQHLFGSANRWIIDPIDLARICNRRRVTCEGSDIGVAARDGDAERTRRRRGPAGHLQQHSAADVRRRGDSCFAAAEAEELRDDQRRLGTVAGHAQLASFRDAMSPAAGDDGCIAEDALDGEGRARVAGVFGRAEERTLTRRGIAGDDGILERHLRAQPRLRPRERLHDRLARGGVAHGPHPGPGKRAVHGLPVVARLPRLLVVVRCADDQRAAVLRTRSVVAAVGHIAQVGADAARPRERQQPARAGAAVASIDHDREARAAIEDGVEDAAELLVANVFRAAARIGGNDRLVELVRLVGF